MPETDSAPTPLYRLAERWQAYAAEQSPSMYGQGKAGVAKACAADLEASLATYDADATLAAIFTDLPWKDGISERDRAQLGPAITAALQSAYAAGQAKGWAECPVSGEHEWVNSMQFFTSWTLVDARFVKCKACRVQRSAIEEAKCQQSTP